MAVPPIVLEEPRALCLGASAPQLVILQRASLVRARTPRRAPLQGRMGCCA